MRVRYIRGGGLASVPALPLRARARNCGDDASRRGYLADTIVVNISDVDIT